MSAGPSDAVLEAAVADLLDELLRLRARERLLVYVDADSDRRLAEAVLAGARARGAHGSLLDLAPLATLERMQQALEDAIGSGDHGVVCEMSGQYFYFSRAWDQALRRGSRIYSSGGLDADSFARCVGAVDHAALRRFGSILHGLFADTRSVRITCRRGTDLRCEMNRHRVSRLFSKLRGEPRSRVWDPSGQPLEPGEATFLEGQLAFVGRRRSIHGSAVVDGHFWPPKDVGALRDPVALRIERGRVTGVDGCPVNAPRIRRWLDGRDAAVEHLCLGFNPGARMDRELCEAERVLGSLTVGVGAHPFHCDGVIRSPSIELSQGTLLRDGRFVHPKLWGSVPRPAARAGVEGTAGGLSRPARLSVARVRGEA